MEQEVLKASCFILLILMVKWIKRKSWGERVESENTNDHFKTVDAYGTFLIQ